MSGSTPTSYQLVCKRILGPRKGQAHHESFHENHEFVVVPAGAVGFANDRGPFQNLQVIGELFGSR
jgi:hypothetical protein